MELRLLRRIGDGVYHIFAGKNDAFDAGQALIAVIYFIFDTPYFRTQSGDVVFSCICRVV